MTDRYQPKDELERPFIDDVVQRIDGGMRFAGLFASDAGGGSELDAILTVALAGGDGVELLDMPIGDEFPSMTPQVAAAFWYERVVHDLFGATPQGHPRLDPLVLPQADTKDGHRYPRPGSGKPIKQLTPSERAVPRFISGPGMFTIPHGPVRSGVTESIEYLVETPGEEIPHLHVRVFAKHLGIERAFEGRQAVEGSLVAERVEGIAGVSHAIAYCQAVETIAGVQVSRRAQFIRAQHAELERIANHLEVVAHLCEGAGLVVAQSRFMIHKETVLRLRHRLCGNRYSRSVVIPGGVNTPRESHGLWLEQALHSLRTDIERDRTTLMVTSSFLDRVRGTGVLTADIAREYGALGPVGRGSAIWDDSRRRRPYGAYRELNLSAAKPQETADALARLQVRWVEIGESFSLLDQINVQLSSCRTVSPLVEPLDGVTGRAAGWAEGPQGETLYVVDVDAGRLKRVWPRSASFHNLVLFHQVFHGDVLTDFAFIEASFGTSAAGVAV